MNVLDIILIIPLIWMAYRGFTKGLIIGLATLAALILGIWAGIRFAGEAAGFVGQVIPVNEKYLPALAFALIFILVLVVVYLIGKMVEKLVDMVALGCLNKLLGAVLGIAKAAILLSVLLYLISVIDVREKWITPSLKDGSFLYRPIYSIVPGLLDFRSKGLHPYSSIAFTPGRIFPSITSSIAPPPVET